jgi:SP family facilitated glucose transporter-like MFS transporter 8
MIAAIPNIIGWLAISFAKVWHYVFALFISTYCLTGDNFRIDDCLMSALQDSSFLYMGRLLEGFGVGIISYVVSVIKLHP